MTDPSSILFWLEQEPVECDADIYMPPDTPIQHQISKITYQIKKKQDLKKQRTIERLKTYHFDQLEQLRERYAKSVIPSKLPKSDQKHYLEVTPPETFLSEKLPDIVKLLEDINTLEKDKENTSSIISTLFAEEAEKRPAPSEEEVERLKLKREFQLDYETVLLESFVKQESDIEKQFNIILDVIKQNKENEQPYTTPEPLPSTQKVITHNLREANKLYL